MKKGKPMPAIEVRAHLDLRPAIVDNPMFSRSHTEGREGNIRKIDAFLARSPSLFIKPRAGHKGNRIFVVCRAGRGYSLEYYDSKARRFFPSLSLETILGMLDGEYSGEYWFDDKPLHKASVKERGRVNKENVGFVFQHFHLLDDLTVYENLEIPLSYRDVSRKEREARVAEILDRFQMVGKKDLYPTQLSGGQQQQVAVARAVIANPRVVLADEPTGSLHWSQGEEIMKLLKGLNDQGTTIVQVSHDERVAAFGRRLIELGDGWISANRVLTGAR
jgi:ABC-type lipoprotein export system ATPase subunit